jgi:hypothetical protein
LATLTVTRMTQPPKIERKHSLLMTTVFTGRSVARSRSISSSMMGSSWSRPLSLMRSATPLLENEPSATELLACTTMRLRLSTTPSAIRTTVARKGLTMALAFSGSVTDQLPSVGLKAASVPLTRS